LEIEAEDFAELPGAEVAATTVPPENRSVFDQFVVDFAKLCKHYVHFLLVLCQSGGDDVLGVVKDPLDVVAGAAILFDGRTEQHGPVVGDFCPLEQVALHQFLVADDRAADVPGLPTGRRRLASGPSQGQQPHYEKEENEGLHSKLLSHHWAVRI